MAQPPLHHYSPTVTFSLFGSHKLKNISRLLVQFKNNDDDGNLQRQNKTWSQVNISVNFVIGALRKCYTTQR